MEIFQSWADIVIMLVIAIAYVWTTIAQSKVIKAKNETISDLTTRNQELERSSRVSLNVASERVKDIEIFKGMYSPDLIKQYLSMHVTVEVNKVKTQAEQQANEDKRMIDAMNDHLSEAISYITFMLHVERKYTREQRIKFFHTYFSKGKDLFWYISNQKIELIESKKALTQSEISGDSSIPDVSTQ